MKFAHPGGNVMLFFKKKKYCDKAIIYLKQRIHPWESEGEFTLELNEQDSLVSEILFDDCFINYLIDDRKSNYLSYVQNRDIQKDGYCKDQLKHIGLRNLEELADEKMVVDKLTEYDIYSVSLDNTFDAALILLDGLWDNNLRQFIKNDFVIAIPARHVLAFCDSQDIQAINVLNILCKEIYEENDHVLSKKLYIRQDGKWEVLKLLHKNDHDNCKE
jgi:uncharacterized protein YtpQ (UPF0354 family)